MIIWRPREPLHGVCWLLGCRVGVTGFYLLVLASLHLDIRYSKIFCRKGQTLVLSSSWKSPMVCDEGIHLGDFTAPWAAEPCHTQPLAF